MLEDSETSFWISVAFGRKLFCFQVRNIEEIEFPDWLRQSWSYRKSVFISIIPIFDFCLNPDYCPGILLPEVGQRDQILIPPDTSPVDVVFSWIQEKFQELEVGF